MVQVAASFGSSKNFLISSSLGLSASNYGAVTVLGNSLTSAVGTLSASITSCRISGVNLFINQTGLQASQSSVCPFTVHFFTASPNLSGGVVFAWQYTWNSTYLGSISLIGASNTQTGSTGSVYSSTLGFGSGTQPGTNGQPLDIIVSPGTTLSTLYFVVVTNYAIVTALTGSPTYVLTLNVSTI